MRLGSEESVGVAVIGVWLLLGIVFILRVPGSIRTYDVDGHIQYTQIIAREGRLPSPLEGHETFQPPLYYLINSRIAPLNPHHVFWVRYLSVFYGALTLGVIIALLSELKIPILPQILALSFLITTPMFVFLFSSYNNDSLATLFSVLLLFLLTRLVLHWNNKTAVILWITIAAGLYTKFTVGFTLIVAGLVLVIIGLHQGWSLRKLARYEAILFTPILLLLPWLIFHNHALSGYYLPTIYDAGLPSQIALPKSPIKTLLRFPFLTPREWHDPFAHLWESVGSKKTSYISYRFSTSLFGEYIFPPLLNLVSWAIVGIHVFIMVWTIQSVQRRRALVAFTAIVLAAIPHYIYMRSCPYGSAMDFRYIAWVWLPWGVLYAGSESTVVDVLLGLGTIVQGVFLTTLMR